MKDNKYNTKSYTIVSLQAKLLYQRNQLQIFLTGMKTSLLISIVICPLPYTKHSLKSYGCITAESNM